MTQPEPTTVVEPAWGGQPPPGMVPAARLRSMIQLLGPDELTPTAKRMLTALCEEAEG